MSLHSNPKSVTQDNTQPMLEEFHEGSILFLQKNIRTAEEVCVHPLWDGGYSFVK